MYSTFTTRDFKYSFDEPHQGKLRINGNPSKELGDINLSLREKGSPVEISPGTKDIVLITALDKEGIEGPSSVYVNVICDRRHSSDPVSKDFDYDVKFKCKITLCDDGIQQAR